MKIINQFYAEVTECLSKYVNQEINTTLKKKIAKEVSNICKKYALDYPHLFDGESVRYSIVGSTISINPNGLLAENIKQGIVEWIIF